MSFVKGIMHIAYDVVAPTRQAHFLQGFGLDALYTFDRRGRYITCIGDPTAPADAVGRPNVPLVAFYVPRLPQARFNHICFDVEDVDEAVKIIKNNGVDIDEEDADRIYGPRGWYSRSTAPPNPAASSFQGHPGGPNTCPSKPMRRPRPSPKRTWRNGAAPRSIGPPPKNAGMVTGIEHVALDVASPTVLVSFLERAFGLTALKTFQRRGRYITSIGDPDAPPDSNGRKRSFLPTFFAPGIERGDINHICFDVDDVEDAVAKITEYGQWVDEEDADRIYGPEGLVWQVDSRKRPRPEFLPGAKPRPEYTPLDQYDPGRDPVPSN